MSEQQRPKSSANKKAPGLKPEPCSNSPAEVVHGRRLQ